MIQFIAGLVVGVFLTIAALNPTDAKRVVNSTVDAVHNSYTAGATVKNGPAVEEAEKPTKKVEK